ncbi:MAG: hypothetical protein H0V17_17655 [Deltaproteobacteria bacterium]|nr:hypothetical protein [Deltaproteobacteria bacterium]
MRWFLLVLLAACRFDPQAATLSTDASSDANEADDAGEDDPPANAIAADPYTDGRSEGEASSLTFEHTVGSGPDRLLLVGVSTSFGNSIVTSIVFDGMPLVRVGQRKAPSQDARVEIWSLLAPSVGTATVAITVDDNSSTIVAGVGSFSHVDQITPLGAFVSAGSMTGDPTVTAASGTGALAVGIVAWSGGATLMDDATQQSSWNQRSGSIIGAGATSTESSPTFRWIAGANESWAAAAVAVLPK